MAPRRLAILTAITALFLLPWTLFVALNGGLIEYFEAGLDYSRGEAAATALTTWPRMVFNSSRASTTNAEAWLFWLSGACHWFACHRVATCAEATGAMVGAALDCCRSRRGRRARQRQLHSAGPAVRLPDAIVPVALLAAWGLGACWTDPWRRRGYQSVMRRDCRVHCGLRHGGRPDFTIGGAIRQLVARPGMSGVQVRAAEVSASLRSSHREDNSSRYATTLLPFFSYLDRCTSTSDRLIVTGEFPDILVLAGRRFAGDGVVFGAWYPSATRQDRTLGRLRADPALFALHMGDYATFRQRFSLIDRYLNLEYVPMADIPVVEGGIIRILALRSRSSTSVDSTTGWPCFIRPTPGPGPNGAAVGRPR